MRGLQKGKTKVNVEILGKAETCIICGVKNKKCQVFLISPERHDRIKEVLHKDLMKGAKINKSKSCSNHRLRKNNCLEQITYENIRKLFT